MVELGGEFATLRVRHEAPVCTIQIYRPEANNTINNTLIEELWQVLDCCDEAIRVVVLEGLPEVFCFGGDFQEIRDTVIQGGGGDGSPERLFDLWRRLAEGPWVSVAHVRGKVNAGGIGFVAACDIVLADDQAVFSLSELLFGLIPAVVMPFLIRRIGFQKAHYMTLMTQPVSVMEAQQWGLVDVYEANSANLLRKHLLRLRRLSKTGLRRYKGYMTRLQPSLDLSREKAIATNKEVFSDRENLAKIVRYVETGQFPWEE